MLFVWWVRTLLFYFIFGLWTPIWCTWVILTIYIIPQKFRHVYAVKIFSIAAIWLCRLICGVKWRIEGQKNIPTSCCVIASNHQSTWETFFLQTLFTPQATVLKKELLTVPFFGWALKTLNPISIDRDNPKEAMKQMNRQGKIALKEDMWVMIFPEGTRFPCTQLGRYTRGAANLAMQANVCILPIVHNAGKFWPNKKWLKTPGVITLKIGSPIATDGLSAKEINDQLVEWTHENMPD